MQPQKTNSSKISAKKKVKNKNWGASTQSGQQPNLPTPPVEQQKIENNHKKFKNISQLASKYSFNIAAVIGSGFASNVYLGHKNDTKQFVCIKAIDLMALGFSKQHIELILKEIQCLEKFNSEYIVRLYDVYESSSFYYLVMELCPGGDLYKMLKMSPINLPPKFINTLIKQIAYGLMQIHQKQIIHRDMKTENVFIAKFPQNQKQEIKVKIGDLGFCITVQQMQNLQKQGKLPQNVGSPIYMSPEVSQYQNYTFSSDIYALGIIWYQLYHKKAPWQALSQQQLLTKKLTLKVQNWREDIQPKFKQIISRCFSNTLEDRPSCKQIINLIEKQCDTVPSVSI